MGKKTGKTKSKNAKKAGKKGQVKKRDQEQSLERFITATMEELLMAVNELPDDIILEVYF